MTSLKSKAEEIIDAMKFPRNSILQKAIEQAFREVRNEALEEAAREAEQEYEGCHRRIRSLKEKP